MCSNFRIFAMYGVFLCCFLMVASCTDDVLENTNRRLQQGLNVKFKVGEIQNGEETNNSKQDHQNAITQPYSNVSTGEALSSADLKPGLLKTTGTASARISLTETTLVNAETGTTTDLTRANITTMATLGNFSSTAYRGSNSGQLNECWFYNEETDKQGNLIQPIQWELAKPYATFYAVYPKPDNSNNILSPRGQALPPYIDFCVEPKVTEQVDLMAACSGEVHLDNANVAPEVFLRFRHALTGIRFKAGAGLTIDKTITKVEILNALSKGRYTLPANGSKYGKWEELSTPANFVLDNINVRIRDAVNNIIIGKY